MPLPYIPLEIESGERLSLTVTNDRNGTQPRMQQRKKRQMVLYLALTLVASFVLIVSMASKGAGGAPASKGAGGAPPADPAPPIDAITVIDGVTILDEAWQRLNPHPLFGEELGAGDLPLNWTPDLEPDQWPAPDLEPDPATDPTNNGTDTDYVECHYMFGGGSLTEAGDECRSRLIRKLLRLLTWREW